MTGTERYLVAADAGRVALQPGEVAAGVDVQEVWPRRVADVHGHVVQAAKKTKRIIFFFCHGNLILHIKDIMMLKKYY